MDLLERLESVASDAPVLISRNDLIGFIKHIDAYRLEEIERLRKIAEQSEKITRKEAAKILGKSEGTLSNWDKSGVLKCFRIGKTPMYFKHEVEGFKNRKQHETI